MPRFLHAIILQCRSGRFRNHMYARIMEQSGTGSCKQCLLERGIQFAHSLQHILLENQCNNTLHLLRSIQQTYMDNNLPWSPTMDSQSLLKSCLYPSLKLSNETRVSILMATARNLFEYTYHYNLFCTTHGFSPP